MLFMSSMPSTRLELKYPETEKWPFNASAETWPQDKCFFYGWTPKTSKEIAKTLPLVMTGLVMKCLTSHHKFSTSVNLLVQMHFGCWCNSTVLATFHFHPGKITRLTPCFFPALAPTSQLHYVCCAPSLLRLVTALSLTIHNFKVLTLE